MFKLFAAAECYPLPSCVLFLLHPGSNTCLVRARRSARCGTPTPCRLKRLGRGEKELARSDFQMIPELAGNPFLPRIFEMYDADGDGYMGAADLRALLESLTRLANEEERYQCAWGLGSAWGTGVGRWAGAATSFLLVCWP